MGYQSINEQKYFMLAETLLDVEVALKAAMHSKNKELSQFARETLRTIAESGLQNGRNE